MPSPRDWNDADKEVVGEALTAALIADPATDKDRPFATWVRYHFAREGSVDALRSEVASLKAAVAELGQNPGGGATKAEVEAAVAPVMAKLTELDFLQPGK